MGAASGQVLKYNGSAWAPAAVGGGTVTEVTVGDGLSVTNGSTTPAISLGTVPVANGGTGATTASGAANAISPDCWKEQVVVGGGGDGTSTLRFSHAGSGGTSSVQFPELSLANALSSVS